ncbi:hypothetical protein HMPREF3187_01707 [Aerococcus christensenii]|uniref:Uncharacterized protein n=1 Tax=Aerococcus christensenii TaxID=87541 RepID=A0A133XQI7_9LACT|nr:hypothetical protein HMPREF3187_01707 [Aerococcus christensenii]
MLHLQTTSKFRKDHKRIKKHCILNIKIMRQRKLIKILENVTFNRMGLLIDAINEERLVLIASRIGSPSDLFNK